VIRYQRRLGLRRGAFATITRRGVRLGARRGRGGASIGASGPRLSMRLARGLSWILGGRS
jgi:hypothetical protein